MNSTDRDALVALHLATGGADWKGKSNWNTDADLSLWHGIKVNAQGQVVSVDLPFNNLRGEIPRELGELRALERLDLSSNELSGEIPRELGELRALVRLNLSWNQLSGEIPRELGELRALEDLFLTANQLSGEIPRELGDLRALVRLDLSSNELSGEIPRERGRPRALDDFLLAVDQMFAPQTGHRFLRGKEKGKFRTEAGTSASRSTAEMTSVISSKGTEVETGHLSELTLHGAQGEQLESDTGTSEEAPPQLQQIFPVLLTFLDSRSWCACLVVSSAARDAVRALFSGLMPFAPRPEEEWTVPLDVLTLKADEAGNSRLVGCESGITIFGTRENLAYLKAVIIPPPQSGFVTVEGEQYIATSPILRCRSIENRPRRGPWTVGFPLEEEDYLSNPTEVSRVLRRGDWVEGEWKVEEGGLKASPSDPFMLAEVEHFSDVMTADKLRDIESNWTKSYYERKRSWGAPFRSRKAHVYNASSEHVTILQVPPPRMQLGGGIEVSLPVVGGGGGGTKEYTTPDVQVTDRAKLPPWVSAASDGDRPPTSHTRFRTLPGTREMYVIPYTVTGNPHKVLPREKFRCLAGYDYYLLDKMVTDWAGYREREVGEFNEEGTVINEVMTSRS